MKTKSLSLPILLFLITIVTCTQQKQSDIILFRKNGGWCWFQDERAIIHNGVLIFGSVATPQGFNGEERAGNIEVTAFDLESKTHLGTAVVHENLEADDHNAPALLLLEDERLLAVYAKHGVDSQMRYRITKKQGDYLNWQQEQTVMRDAGVTYSNLLYLSQENDGNGRSYNFYRGEYWNPNFVISDDQGKTWRYGGRLIAFDGRPYVKYISDGVSKIHFITTEHHPRDFNNSIYHAYIQNGKLFTSDASFIKNLSGGPLHPTEGTKIFAGDSANVAWTIDIHLDAQGHPYIAYMVQKNRDPSNMMYRYARWDGDRWNDQFLSLAGTALYPPEAHYTGLVALDPGNPNIVYISTDVNPVTGTELISRADNKRHYEIFKGTSENNGQDWAWEMLTRDSDADNLRPIMPINNSRYNVLLWLNGTYQSYVKFNLDVVGIINP